MEGRPTLDEMWREIEEFGINRKVLDPHGTLEPEQVEEIYLVIQEKRMLERQFARGNGK